MIGAPAGESILYELLDGRKHADEDIVITVWHEARRPMSEENSVVVHDERVFDLHPRPATAHEDCDHGRCGDRNRSYGEPEDLGGSGGRHGLDGDRVADLGGPQIGELRQGGNMKTANGIAT